MNAEYMCDLLKFEADLQTVQIYSNSISLGGMTNSVNREQERKKYISKVGYLYPDFADRLNQVSDQRTLVAALEGSPYEGLMKLVASNEDRNEVEAAGATLDEVMLAAASKKYSQGFEGAFHYGCFYAYLKLKEQEEQKREAFR